MIDVRDPLHYQRIEIWKKVPLKKWNDWRWQIANSATDAKSLSRVIKLSQKEYAEIDAACTYSKFRVTPYYLSLIDQKNPECPIRLQVIPSKLELERGRGNLVDPLAEDADMVVPRLVHRYPDRALFLVSEVCSTYCRFCTRRRLVIDKAQEHIESEHDRAISYIREHKEIRDVIVSGGDALMLSAKMLDGVLKKLRKIPHVVTIRVASRTPCVFPQRVTDEYVNVIKKYQPIFFMTHFNHPYEITPEAAKACARIIDAGIPMFNQSVLLRRINSHPAIMKRLVYDLLKIRVKPYYIYQCDPAQGIDHFRTSVSKGIEIMEFLRGHASGLAQPTLVIDAPGGGGKIPVMPNYLLTLTDESTVVRNYRGLMSSYINPKNRDSACSTAAEIEATLTPEVPKNRGYLDLLEGKRVKLEPKL